MMGRPRSRQRDPLCRPTRSGFAATAAATLALALALSPAPSSAQQKIKVADWPDPVPQAFAKGDGMPMVIVPAGPFIRGSDRPGDSGGDRDEAPSRQVQVGTFYIDRYEVTNAHYRAFMAATGASEPQFMRTGAYGRDEQPVVGVSWQEAAAYARWAGKRLPTEAEWEKAARGTDGRLYPWGNELKGREANTRLAKVKRPTPVNQFADDISPYGVVGMAGNVAEWVWDRYDENYYGNSPQTDPKGPEAGDRRVIRGGSWDYDADKARALSRNAEFPSTQKDVIGFRCAWDPRMQAEQLRAAEQAPETVISDFSMGLGSAPETPAGPAAVSASRGVQSEQEQLMAWETFNEQFGRLFEAHRPLVGSMEGNIASIYPAQDRRDVFFVNLADRHFNISIVNANKQAIVYDENVRVNSSLRKRLPIAGEKFRVYIIENGVEPQMEYMGEIAVPGPSGKPMSVVFDLEGKYDKSKPRIRVVDGKVNDKSREFALVNQTDNEVLFILSDMDELRVFREYRVPPNAYLIDTPQSGRYRVVGKYLAKPDFFHITDDFAFQVETVRQTIVASPMAIVRPGEFAPMELARSVYVPE